MYDILLNNRLHCSDITQFNDPFEGLFVMKYLMETKIHESMDDGKKSRLVYGVWDEYLSSAPQAEAIISVIQSKKVCALSNKKDDVLIWSHYANGYY